MTEKGIWSSELMFVKNMPPEEVALELKNLRAFKKAIQEYSMKLIATPLDPYDNAFNDAPERVTIPRRIGEHLKQILSSDSRIKSVEVKE